MRILLSVCAAIGLVLVSIGATGCASVFDADNDSVITVESNPPGAEVFLSGVSRGKTPAQFSVSDDGLYDLKITYEGESRSIAMTRSIGPKWIILDVIFGLIPVVVDAITGNWYEVQPQEIFVDFTVPEGTADADAAGSAG